MKVKVTTEKGYARVIATAPIAKNENILSVSGNILPAPNKYTIQIAPDKHLESFTSDYTDTDSLWRFINHSCKPNCAINITNRMLFALQEIKTGEEITFDYNTTEAEISSPFVCNCGAKNCLKYIRGYKYLNREQSQMN